MVALALFNVTHISYNKLENIVTVGGHVSLPSVTRNHKLLSLLNRNNIVIELSVKNQMSVVVCIIFF